MAKAKKRRKKSKRGPKFRSIEDLKRADAAKAARAFLKKHK